MPAGFHRPPKRRAPSPSKARSAWGARVNLHTCLGPSVSPASGAGAGAANWGTYGTSKHLGDFLYWNNPDDDSRANGGQAYVQHVNGDGVPQWVHGGVRACIACGYCAQVCPVDILPQLTFKAVLADAVEEFLAHGLLDCVECGLCTYVCPSKIELADILVHAKAAYYKEQTA